MYRADHALGEPPQLHRVVERRTADEAVLAARRRAQCADGECVLSPGAVGARGCGSGGGGVEQCRHVPRVHDRVLARAHDEPAVGGEFDRGARAEVRSPCVEETASGHAPEVETAARGASDAVRRVLAARDAVHTLRRLAPILWLVARPDPHVQVRARGLGGEREVRRGEQASARGMAVLQRAHHRARARVA